MGGDSVKKGDGGESPFNSVAGDSVAGDSGPLAAASPSDPRIIGRNYSGPLSGLGSSAGRRSPGYFERTPKVDDKTPGVSPIMKSERSERRNPAMRHSYGGESVDQLNPLYRVSLPSTPDHQAFALGSESPAGSPMVGESSATRDDSTPYSGSQMPPWRLPEQNSIVANTIFTGGFRNDPRGHIMMTNEHQSFKKEPQLDPQVGPRSVRCGNKGCDQLVMRDEAGNEIHPCVCQFKICQDCYRDIMKEDGAACPGCKERYRRSPFEDGDDENAQDQGVVPEFIQPKRQEHVVQLPDSEVRYFSKDKKQQSEQVVDAGDSDSSEERLARSRSLKPKLNVDPAVSMSMDKSSGHAGDSNGHGPLAIVRKDERDLKVLLYGDSKAEYGYGSAVWPKAENEKMYPGPGGGGGGGGSPGSGDSPLQFFDERGNRPLARKLPVSVALISPYRFMVLLRFVILIFFLRWRFLNPTPDAVWLWLASVICEAWFGLSWALDQLPKLNPVVRHTDLDVLREKFEVVPTVEDGGKAPMPTVNCPLKSYLPGVDIFVSTADPEKEPVITTANTVLSILAANFPVDKIACYVSDDGGALLTFEALAETASFAHVWIPFCRKHNIEPRCPEYYFQQKGDPTKGKLRPDFVKDRRRVKREYDEFKVRINGLPDAIRRRSDDLNSREELRLHKGQMALDSAIEVKHQKATWMADGSKWPGAWSEPHKDHAKNDHAGIIQVMLAPPNPDPRGHQEKTDMIDVSDVDTRLPLLVYVSREKRPGYDHNKKAGAMNALIRTSAIMSNGAFILNLDCDHYIYNSDALREAMCFMMARGGEKICYVQFPQRFEGIDPSDRYANQNTVFFDINMRGLDGIQGPFYAGTGCVFRRTALYGMDPPLKRGEEKKKGSYCGLCCGGRKTKKHLATQARQRRLYAAAASQQAKLQNGFSGQLVPDKVEEDGLDPADSADFALLPKQFGSSQAFLASIMEAEEAGKPLGQGNRGLVDENGRPEDGRPGKEAIVRQPLDAETVADAILVISSWYEDKSEWGRRIGWIYGSVTEDVVTGYRMHNRGWKSVYAHPARPAFKGTAPINLTDRLHQVLRWATGSVEIFFSRNNAIFAGSSLRCLQRMAYINVGIYPFTSIFLTVYCFLPAICLFTNKFITPEPISITALIYIFSLTLATFCLAVMEVRWSGITLEEWWRNEQFWVIGGTSAHLAAVYQGLLKVLAGVDISFTLTAKGGDDDYDDQFADLYRFQWTSLMIPPLTIMMVNLIACIMGAARTIYSPYPSWSELLGKIFFSFWVLIHLYPFAKGLTGRKNRAPTIVYVWSGLLSIVLSLIWINITPPEGVAPGAASSSFTFP